MIWFALIVVALTWIILSILQTLEIRRLRRERDALISQLDHALLQQQRQKDAALAVVPFLAKSSVAMSYGEQNDVQYSFAQRQEISRKVQTQNTALRNFNAVFNVSTTQEMMARAGYGDPAAQAAVEEMRAAALIEELGRDDDLPPASSSPWPGVHG